MATELKTFQTEFKNQNIIIPLLQRDYVQGGRFDVIEPFLGQLISALKDDVAEMNLNYIYGYNKGNGFVPIDGQQRLITLWLLHLYLNPHNFEVKLQFESREFADNFCEQLRNNLFDILDKQGENDNLKDLIIDSEWFVSGWLLDTTVSNMLNTLQLIDDSKERIPDNPCLKNITFDFLDINNEGIDEDVYVKMNGRGRPLSYFENLKSWMDEQIKSNFGEDNAFKDWRIKMDNDWTELFWKNRNTKQDYPEEIDDEQIRFFYSMLLLYWKMDEDKFLTNLKIAKESSAKLHFISFLNEWEKEEKNKLAADTADIKDIRKKTFAFLLNGEKMLPLYWINETDLFNKDVFLFINDGLDVLKAIEKYVSPKETDNYAYTLEGNITCILDFNEEQSFLYHIALNKDDTTYSKTLPLLYALIKTPESYRSENVFKWVRLWRNLVLNSDINADNIGNACKTIDFVSKKIGDNNIYQVISELRWEKGFAFSEEQFNEEIAKAKKIIEDSSWEELIIDAERCPYLLGKIWVLFQNGEQTSKELFRKRYSILNSILDNQDTYYLPKILLSYYDKGKPELNFELKKSIPNWKKLLTDKNNGLFNCFQKIESDTINPNIQYQWIKDIAKTNLLNCSRDNAKIVGSCGNSVILWGTAGCKRNVFGNEVGGNVIIGNHRTILVDGNLELQNKNIVVPNTNFVSYFDVNFKYNERYFQWYGTPNDNELDVYLMEENWGNYKKRPNQTTDKSTEEDTYYCFRVTKEMEKDTSLFTKELDRIINEAIKNDLKSTSEQ